MKRVVAVGGLILAAGHYLFWAALPVLLTMYLFHYKYFQRLVHDFTH